jgi:hypothetical protein
MNISEFTVRDYLLAKDELFEEGDELFVHSWVLQLLENKASSIVADMALNKMDVEEIINLIKEELLTTLALGIEMGTQKIAKEWSKQGIKE